jgi:hypothetical protein
MTSDISTSLTAIKAALERLGRHVVLASLNAGLSPEAVRSSLATAGLASASELEALYGWRNGTSIQNNVTLDDVHLFPGFYLLSLEDSIANYSAFVSDSRWMRGWLPLFANGGGDFYVLDLDSPERSIRHFRIDETEHPVEFHSLRAMLSTLAEAFEQNIFFVDSNGYLEMDDLVFHRLAAAMNADVPWWRG